MFSPKSNYKRALIIFSILNGICFVVGCSNDANCPLQTETVENRECIIEEKREKPGVAPAKELNTSIDNSIAVGPLSKVTQKVNSSFYDGFTISGDSGAWFYGDGNLGSVYRGEIAIGYDEQLSLERLAKHGITSITTQEAAMFRDQIKWFINYWNTSTNIGPKFVYNETNNATKFVLTLLDAAGSLYGGIWREHPLDQIVININVVRWAITYGQIDDLRETIIHEIGHYAGLAHTNDPNCALIPGTPAEDPPSVMYDHNVIAPEYSYYDLLALKYALPNRVGLNRGLDFIPVPPGGPIDGNSWKFWDKTSFPDENYSVDEIATGGSSNIEWTYDNNPFVGALDKDCVTSGDISDNEWTWLRLRFNTARDGTQLSFSYYTDTEKNWDFFEVYVGLYRQPVTLVHRVSGFKYWNKITITLPVSDRCDVYFYYTKDGSISTGTDQVNIDHTTLSR